MIGSGDASTVEISRDHECAVLEPTGDVRFPVYSMIGGKWTTFRAFAEQVTDRLLERLGRDRRTGTEHLAIGGGKDYPRGEAETERWLTRLHERTGLPQDRLATLLQRYGTRAETVAQFLVNGPDEPLRQHPGYSRREIEFLVRAEQVVHLDDLVLRRTAIALLGGLTNGLLDELAGIAAQVHGWSHDDTERERRRAVGILRDRFGLRTLAGETA